MNDSDCLDSRDPSGVPFAELDPALLRTQRTSLKWTRYDEDVLPLFVAEMDFAIAPVVRKAITDRVEASDIGYLDGPGELAPAFAAFARDRWGWNVPHDYVHLATDVATGIVEALRVVLPQGGRIILPTPTYPSFFEMLEEVPFDTLEIPLLVEGADPESESPNPSAQLDLAAIERAFAAEPGVDALLLCNPQNPHGVVHAADDLRALAKLAATHDVFIISDEIHAPLTHSGVTFTPFAPLAAEAGARAVTTSSASKGWNIAGAKCSVLVAADDAINQRLQALPPEVITRVSILGYHASIAAFREGRDWLDRAIAQIEANDRLLTELLRAQAPSVRAYRPRGGYLAWLDLRHTGLGEDPSRRILHEARVALSDGAIFGKGGTGHARLNLACAPDTIREAVARIASIIPAKEPA